MIFGLFKKKKHNQAIVERQYDALTRVARMPAFYSALGVPDTVMGRYEMLSVVMILFFRRTAQAQTSGQELAQEIVDAFFQDLDHSIRELGVGDQGVPKRMKKLAKMFYGRLESYARALDAADTRQLAESLGRNIHPGAHPVPDMSGLAAWMLQAERHLAAISEDQIAQGAAMLPAPGSEE